MYQEFIADSGRAALTQLAWDAMKAKLYNEDRIKVQREAFNSAELRVHEDVAAYANHL